MESGLGPGPRPPASRRGDPQMRSHGRIVLSAGTLLFAAVAAVAAAATARAAAPASALESRRAALRALLHEHWQYRPKASPQPASSIGDHRHNDQLSDLSQPGSAPDL